MRGLGLGLSMTRRGGASFNPVSLFAASEKGIIFDPSDISSLKQNSNGTGAVSSAADPVGYIADKSPNGFNGTQATSGQRPTYEIVSGKPVLRFAVISPPMCFDVPLVAAASDWTVVAGVKSTSTNPFSYLIDAATGRLIFVLRDTNANVMSYYDGSFHSTASAHGTVQKLSWVLTSGAAKTRADGVDVSTGGSYTQKAASGNVRVGASSDATPSDGFIGDLYGLIIINRALSASELANAEAWVAARL